MIIVISCRHLRRYCYVFDVGDGVTYKAIVIDVVSTLVVPYRSD